MDDTTIQANLASGQYQWLDCENNYTLIPNATGQIYSVNQNGIYAVEITDNGCVDTSNCILINSVGGKELINEIEYNIYPNPTSGTITIEWKDILEKIELYDAVGRLKKEFYLLPSDKKETLDLTNISSGVYRLVLYSKKTKKVEIIKIL